MSFTYRFDDALPGDWTAFLARIERALERGDILASGDAYRLECARKRAALDREAERQAWIASEQARIDTEKAKPTLRQRVAGVFR